MVLLLTDDDVRRVLTMKDALAAIEDVFRERALGRAFELPRARLYAPIPHQPSDFWLNTMAAAVPKLKVAAMRVSTGMSRALRDKEKIVVSRKTDRTFLYSTETGEMVSVVHNDYLQKLRVGASTGIATKYLARPDARTVGVFGSGRQARTNLIAIAAVRELRRVLVFSPTAAHRDAYCAEMSDVLKVEVVVAPPREVVEGSDIILAATNSRIPVFQGEWLKPGAHVIAVVAGDSVESGHELDATVMSRADIIVVNSEPQIYADHQRLIIDLVERGHIDRDTISELGDIVAGRRPGRVTDEQITVYHNNVGMGIQFAACAAFALEKACELGLGRELAHADFNEYLDGVADIGRGLDRIGPHTYSEAATRTKGLGS